MLSARKTVAALAAAALVPVLALLGTAPPAQAAAALSQAWEDESTGQSNWSGITVADIDGNGTNEILSADHTGHVSVHTADGALVWRKAAFLTGCGGCTGSPSAIDTTPTAADLNKDGILEIIVGVGSIDVPNQPGGLVVLDSNGNKKWQWTGDDTHNQWNSDPASCPVTSTGGNCPDGYPESVRSVPAVGDVDGDGNVEVVFGGMDLKFYVLSGTGAVKASFYHDDTIFSGPALHDVDGDGTKEIFFGGDSTPGAPEDWSGGVLRALRFQGGKLVEMWKVRKGDYFQSTLAIGDINGDGRFEVVTGGSNVRNRPEANRIWAFHVKDGSPVSGWPFTVGGPTYGSVALGDVDNDGKTDVVANDLGPGGDVATVTAIRGNGTKIWSVDPHARGEGGGELASSPIIADLDGDGDQDVVTANGWGTFLLRGTDGGRLFNPIGVGWSYHGIPAVGRFGGSSGSGGTTKLIIQGFGGGKSRVAAYDLAGSTAPAWPQFKMNAAHTGGPNLSGREALPKLGPCGPDTTPASSPNPDAARGYWFLGGDGSVYSFGGAPFYGSLGSIGVTSKANAIAAAPSGGGYWILAQDGGVFTFGDARFYGSMGGKPLNGPVVRLVPTSTGNGYWLLASDGGVFSFGDATFYGSMGGERLNGPVISMSRTSSGKGYWLVGSDGGVFSFGDARFHGSTGGQRLNAPVNTMTAGASGYWLLAGDGGVFAFNVPFYGSVPGLGLCGNPQGVVLRATGTGKGYWVLGADGGVFSFGDAAFYGSQPGLVGDRRAVDLAPRI